MTVNYIVVLICAVLSMVLGSVWYGPLFGRKWMEIIKANPDDVEARKRMQKSAGPLYLVQFLLSLFQVWVLARAFGGSPDAPQNMVWIWAGVIMPTLAGVAMWNNDSAKVSWARFLIQAGYQLILFVLFGLIIGRWG